MPTADLRRADYLHLHPIATRWSDNDVYGHVNNVVYYSYFDTAVNQFLIAEGVLDIATDPVVGFVVETGCTYFRPVVFPDRLEVGIRVARLGSSSVRYELALFRDGEPQAAAAGHFVHVYVDRQTGRSAPIPAPVRQRLQALLWADPPPVSPPQT